jgi:hypothetical protein
MADQKVSLLVNRQVPEYIREEYPVFISFLEAYYEFLEQKQGTQLNDLVSQSKGLRTISDVDLSIEDFEQNFFNTFADLLPRDVAIDKASLIKNVLPLYLSKGSESSFKLLYRMMFGDELEIKYPKNDVLRASDGKWEIENALKISTEIYSYYTGDGTKTQFKILPCRCPITAQPLTPSGVVTIDGVVQTGNYNIRKESKKLIFNTAPASGADIRVQYSTFDSNLLTNRKITGQLSGSTALIEKVSTKIINQETIIELYINDNTRVGDFVNGENILCDVLVDDVLVEIITETISNALKINITDGGAGYNVGDPVIINTPVATVAPSAIISKTFKGTINQVIIEDGGAGFMVGERIAAVGYSTSELNFAVANLNLTGANTSNTFTIYSNIISDVGSNTHLDATDWNITGNISPTGNINLSSMISSAFSNVTYTSIGEISNISFLAANVAVSSPPVLNAAPAYVSIPPRNANTSGNTVVTIDTFGSVGKIVIRDGGTNYQIFDELNFINQPMCFGVGAAAVVSNTSTTGRITEVRMLPSKITGTANVTSVSNVMVHGTGTAFNTELVPGDSIMIGFDTRKVVSIASATSLNVDSYFSDIYINKPIRKPGKDLLGGQGYKQEKLPTITVTSTTGANAVLVATAIMGDGESLIAKGTKRPGEIEEIIITNPGRAIKVVPTVNLSSYGDGTGKATLSLNPSYETFEGRWSTSDGILSSLDRKLQGRNYYVNYSYLLSSATEFSKYKKIFNELLHPTGFKAYAELNKLDVLQSTPATLSIVTAPKNIKSMSGRVNVANASIYVTGQGTKFNVANSLGIITVGSYIAINSEIRVVSSIISNTNLAVSSAYTITANNEELVVVNTVYDAIETETTLEDIISENELTLIVE